MNVATRGDRVPDLDLGGQHEFLPVQTVFSLKDFMGDTCPDKEGWQQGEQKESRIDLTPGVPHLPGVQSCKNFKGNLIHVLLPVCNSSSRLCVNRTSLWLEAIFFFFYFSLSLPPLFFLFKRMPFLSSTGSWLGPKTNRVVAESSQGQLGASQHSLSRFLTSNLLPVLSSSLAGSQ